MKKAIVTLAAVLALGTPALAGGHSNASEKGAEASGGSATATPDGLAGSNGVGPATTKGGNKDRE